MPMRPNTLATCYRVRHPCTGHVLLTGSTEAMEFRPMIEMTPDQLLPQVQITMLARAEKMKKDVGKQSQAATRILTLLASDSEDEVSVDKATSNNVAVDPLSLSLLTAQGFEEEQARMALRHTHNDTQAALDWLLNPPAVPAATETNGDVETSVRLPKTTKLLEKLRAFEEKRKAAAARGADDEVETMGSVDTDGAVVSADMMVSKTPEKAHKRAHNKRSTRHRRDSSASEASSESAKESVSRHRRRSRPRRRTRVKEDEDLTDQSDSSDVSSRHHRSSNRRRSRSHRERHSEWSKGHTRRTTRSGGRRRRPRRQTSSESSEISEHERHKLEQQRKLDDEVNKIRSRIPRMSSLTIVPSDPQDSKRRVAKAESILPPQINPGDSRVSIFKPSELPPMLNELLPIGVSPKSPPDQSPSNDPAESSNLPIEGFRDLLGLDSVASSSSESNGGDVLSSGDL
eukprot:Blabericola_migrator_1__11493@NODE_685_length_6880_cov_118_696756_g498_i0_p2_GENE_NODE_685_length_6880_cov_118_696756_g498_i0NODE_685_length_6880_cov_118_696756_g498_i0_p2_ORF_typecomplete_len458_score89_99UBA/PF00627_31/6e09UBA/PF00627_31/1_3e04HBS1_N/PF08938_10/0_28HBS1_N/PF08938_10/4_1e03_NODE_685_length_6880_cov_118_696756_g498_i046686041